MIAVWELAGWASRRNTIAHIQWDVRGGIKPGGEKTFLVYGQAGNSTGMSRNHLGVQYLDYYTLWAKLRY